MPTYLVRLAQIHESFRLAELHALAELAGVDKEMEILRYDDDSPYCLISLPSDTAATQIATRAMLIQGIYELWGEGPDYAALHANIKTTTSHQWDRYANSTFSFRVERYRGLQPPAAQIAATINSFAYLGFKGKVQMKDPEAKFRVFEFYTLDGKEPTYVYLGRRVAESGRDAKSTYDLKKRHYISTTSMDAELALLTANIALAGPGKLFYDPFMGTGGFPLACAHYGAVVTGSDIDGRSIRGSGGSARRGQTGPKNVGMNFEQYGTQGLYLGGFVSDLTNTPLRLHGPAAGDGQAGRNAEVAPYLDGIVCDPPYGIREGLKVLGTRDPLQPEERANHAATWQTAGYLPPKRPYSFTALLDDILAFAVLTLVPGGRLSMWLPTANDADVALIIPSHPCLELKSVCVQPFNKWSRRLLTYRRLADAEVDQEALAALKAAQREYETGTRASDLNEFRRKYFDGFRGFEDMKKEFVRMKVDAGIKQAEAEAEAELIAETQESAGEKAQTAKQEVEDAVKAEEAAAAKAEELNKRFGVEGAT
ncbi:tRNA guanosine-2'-O-methyltransferas-like protein TRM11 [Boeremia exigua]|uniref:tRNA guanosine-2'-O-methyltransferase-like protein TRM11 n=1 Tax=Boeremia exigua TaxID=749465 RepID=UPI001E8D3EA8|nr:tRNA guanosine-2'-O-methyltransferase-like protein TRM11 [Boeremia exigua]KAH6615258.1 tRNA guanosine-2'-O-methyltransferas-like protein TRM11 [Boeremia exigua]